MQPAVTVGPDGSPESLAAARWAAGEAEKRKLPLRLLHAWPLPAPEPARVPSEVDQNHWAKRLVRTARAELRARHPGLSIVGNLVTDDARNALGARRPRGRGPEVQDRLPTSVPWPRPPSTTGSALSLSSHGGGPPGRV